QALAQGPEDPGHRFLDRDRFRQDPGGAVLREDSLLGTLALGQVEDERDALFAILFEARHADEHRHAAAVFAEVLLLEGVQAPAPEELGYPLFVAPAPFGGSQGGPVEPTRGEIRAVISHRVEEGVVRLENPAFEIPDEDPDDVGVDQAADPRFAFL